MRALVQQIMEVGGSDGEGGELGWQNTRYHPV